MVGLEKANSTEFDEVTPNKVVIDMPEISKTHKGGTMRLGKRRTNFYRKEGIMCRLLGRGCRGGRFCLDILL